MAEFDGMQYFSTQGPSLTFPDTVSSSPDYSGVALSRIFGAGQRRENTLGALRDLSLLNGIGMEDEGFDPFQDNFMAGYEEHAVRFIDVRSRSHGEAVKRLIDRQDEDLALTQHSGAWGMLAIAAGVLGDPTNLLPLANLRRVTRLGRAISGAKRGAVLVAGQETVLQAAQVNRTGTESFLNIGATTLFSALIAGALPRASNVSRYSPDDAAKLDDDINALFRDLREAETFAEEGRIVENVPRETRGVGAEVAPGAERATPEQARAEEGMMKALGLEKIPDSPLKRALNATEILVREVAQRLVETPFFLNKHLKGKTSGAPVEAEIRKWWWPVIEGIHEIDRQYALYRGATGQGRMRTNARIAFNDLLNRGRGDKLSPEEFRREITKAMRNNDEALDGNEYVTAAAKAVRRNVLEPMKKDAGELGIWTNRLRDEIARLKSEIGDLKTEAPGPRLRLEREINLLEEEILRIDKDGPQITTAKSFMPRFYRHDLIMADYDRFKSIIRDHLRGAGGVRGPDLEKAVGDVVENILREKPYTPIDDEAIGFARSFRQRTLDIPDTLLEDFLENDVEALIRYYVRTTSADIELTRAFGSHDMADVIEQIRTNYQARVDIAKGAEMKKKLRAEMARAVADIRGMRDRLRGTYGLPDDPYRKLSRFYRGIKQFNYLTMLGGVVISSIPDIGRLVMTEGVQRAFGHAIIPWVRNFEAAKLSLRETKMAGAALDMELGFRAQAFAELGDTFGRHSPLERALMGGSAVFSVMNLFNPWNTVMKGMAGSVVAHRIGEVTMKLAKRGKVAEKEIARLARGGIDGPMAERIGRQFKEHHEINEGLMLANTEKWNDAGAADAYRMAIAQDVDRIIVTPGAGDRPLWMSTELGSVVGQFKAFSVASAQRVLIPGIQMKDARTLHGVVTMMGLGMLVDDLKRRQYGGSRPQNMRQRLMDGFDRSGLSGYFMDINRVVERLSDHQAGLNAMMGVDQPFKSPFRSKIGSVLGPTADQLARMAEILTDFGSMNYDRQTAGALRRMMLGQNLFWAKPLFDQVENAMRP